METVKQLKRQKFIDGLREFANFLESRPNYPTESFEKLNLYVYADKLINFIGLVKALGSSKKQFDDNQITVIKTFGDEEAGIFLQVFMNKEGLGCKKVVTGKRIIPAITIPEREEETFEWECTGPSLLAKVEEIPLTENRLDKLLMETVNAE